MTLRYRFALAAALALAAMPDAVARADAWQPVPPMDWAGVGHADFRDNELDVPHLLHHFHRVANAVVEQGEHRGFIDIKVNRDPKDNAPHNARVLENHLAFAYFLTADRPWNPYRGSPAVRQRLEAVLDFWCRIQGPTGLFSEYRPGDFTLAPTGFGVLHMAYTLELLHASPAAVDAGVLARATAAQRKAVMAVLTDPQMMRHGQTYSNQFSGAYAAALSYIELRPDPEMRAALAHAMREAERRHQSPAGFFYEAGGPDFGYSSVHETNLRAAWPDLKADPALAAISLREDADWNHWLGYNLVRQPDGSGYVVNAGLNCRTGFSFHAGKSRPLAERVEASRAFALTDAEARAQVTKKRAALAADWPAFPELRVPSPYAYQAGALIGVIRDLDAYHPTHAEKAAAVAKLPYLAADAFAHQTYEPWGYASTFVRRPGYYAVLNTGKVRQPRQQVYGLGLLWSPSLGAVMQSVGGTEIAWGTRAAGADAVYERQDVKATISVVGTPVTPEPGHRDLPAGTAAATYALGRAAGRKAVTLSDAGVEVVVEHPGAFTEQLPLLVPTDGTLDHSTSGLRVRKGGATFAVEFDPGTRTEVGPAKPFVAGLQRVMVVLHAADRLTYRLAFEGK